MRSSSLRGPILVVDDDESVRDALGGQLECEGYAVTLCADGAAALDQLSQTRFPVILSDQKMPGISGLELLGRAREMQPSASRILITGILSLDTLVRAINEGEIHRFLAKPWARAELLATVESALQRHELHEVNYRLLADAERLRAELATANAGIEIARHESELLSEARESIEESRQRSLGLCHRLLSTFSATLGKRAQTVVEFCGRMADAGAFSDEDRHVLITGAWLHDLGLIAMPRTLLKQLFEEPHRCTTADWSLIRQHPLHSQTLAAFVDPLLTVGRTIRAHHERWDGSGYPDRLTGSEIPWPARCLAVAVAFAELPLARDAALAAILRQGGSAFDPEAVKIFREVTHAAALPRRIAELSLRDAQPGMQLAKGVYSSSGVLLMAEGQELTHGALSHLRDRGGDAVIERLLVYR